MAGLLLYTHATIWYLEGSPRLSAPALRAVEAALDNAEPVYVSAVTVVELVYLVEKGRFPSDLLDRLIQELHRPAAELRVAALDLMTAETLRTVSTVIRDMPDRMIAATAIALGVALVTRDRQIGSAGIPVIW